MTEVIILPGFEKDAKKLSKKYSSLKNELIVFIDSTQTKGVQGVSLGSGLFKARLAVKSKGKGKSGGLRIISYHDVILARNEDSVYLVAIYDKSELSTMEIKQINKILKSYNL